MKGILLSGFGGLAAAFGSAVCCSGPVVLASLGLSGAALAAWRPYRPIFVIAAVGLLWLAFRLQADEAGAACGTDPGAGSPDEVCGCADPVRRQRTRAVLVILTALSFLLLISPRWVSLVI